MVLLASLTKRSKRRLVFGALLVVAGASTGAAIASESTGPDLSAPSPTGVASSVPAELAAQFAVLSNPRVPSDALPSEAATSFTASGSFGVHYGVNVDLSHLIGEAGGTSVWLVPGNSGSCIWVSTGGSVCGPNESVSTEGVFMAYLPTNKDVPPTVAGIVPDGAVVTGNSAASTVQHGNTFFVTGTVSAIGESSVTITNRAGQVFRDSFPNEPPPNPSPEGAPVVSAVKPNKGCAHQPLPVEISGAGFSGAKAVHFGEDEVRSFTVVSDNVITATTPQYTGNALEEGGGLLGISKHVTVTTAGGTSAQSSADEFFFTVGC